MIRYTLCAEHKRLGLNSSDRPSRTCRLPNLNIWGAKYTLVWIIYPILRRRYESESTSYPEGICSLDEWKDIQRKILYSFEWTLINESHLHDETKFMPNCNISEGFELFGKYFSELLD